MPKLIFHSWTGSAADIELSRSACGMCPSVWLTLDILAGRQKPNSGSVAVTHYIDNWLDKLKANRQVDGQTNEFSNVQFAKELESKAASAFQLGDEVDAYEEQVDGGGTVKNYSRKKKKKKYVEGKKKSVKKKESKDNLDSGDMEEMKPLVDCSFDLPKSQVGCQRLMGTNVVRLTDKSFMQELRRRIKDDYNSILQKRIAVREAKEIERERTLAISSRTGCIPQTLAGKPVNLFSKSSNDMSRRRAKLKTNREKNAEKLIRQGIKWERERLINYELEKKKLLEAQKRREEELMVDRSEWSNRQYLQPKAERRGSNNELPKTQIEDSSATDKLESIDFPDHPRADQDTDDGESESDFEQEGSNGLEKDQPERKKEEESQEASNSKVKDIETHPTKSTATGKPVNAIIITGDGIMERLMAAETVEELYLIAEEIIGKTKVKRMKHLLST